MVVAQVAPVLHLKVQVGAVLPMLESVEQRFQIVF
jgi:hypothetical protein